MKLTIDTKEDSHEDIRKVIKMLEHLVGENSYSNYSSNEPSSRNIFDDPSPSLSSSSEEMNVSEEPENVVGGDAESAAPTNAFSAMFGDNAPSPSASENNESEITPYGEYDGKEKKLNLDEEIIPY